MTRDARRRRLAAGPRRGESGMSLVELLLALSLLVVISAGLIAGLLSATQAFKADGRAQSSDDVDDAVQALSRLLATALPIVRGQDTKHPIIDFVGRDQALSFITLGDGRATRGGLQAVSIGLDRGDLVVEITPTRETVADLDPGLTRRVVLLRNARAFKLLYFGSLRQGETAAWHSEWIKAERQPRLVSIHVEGTASGRLPIVAVSPLPQG